MHDLLLDFVRYRIERVPLEKAVVCQARYLGSFDVVQKYANEDVNTDCYYTLVAFWRSLETLSDDTQLQVEAYHASLRGLEEEPSTDTASFSNIVGKLWSIQVSGRYTYSLPSTSQGERASFGACGNGAAWISSLSSCGVRVVASSKPGRLV